MSKVYVWYSKATSKTGKALASLLSCECGIKAPKRRHDIVITYGAVPKTVTSSVLSNKRSLNNAFRIKAYTNKYIALCSLHEHGVSVPAFSLDPSDITGRIIKRTHKHHGGSGFQLFDDNSTLFMQSGFHFVQYIENHAEYRVHVFCGKVIKVSRKKPNRENPINECRSHSNGWYFSKCDIERVPAAVKEQGIKAVEALGYDFGAVDVIYNRGGDAYVLEVNSGMGLDNSGLALYVENIKAWINELENNGEQHCIDCNCNFSVTGI